MTDIMTTTTRNFYNKKVVKPKKIYCNDCQRYTLSIEPIIVRRYNIHSFSILAVCDNCENLKSCAITDFYEEKFPLYYFDLPIGKSYLNHVPDRDDQKNRIIEKIYYVINGE
jgi:hypothetical protein